MSSTIQDIYIELACFLETVLSYFDHNKGNPLALFAFGKCFLAVFAQSNKFLEAIWFENGFLSVVPICAILK